MRKLLLLAVIGFGVIAAFYYYQHFFTPTEIASGYRIAICTPTTHLALEEIEQGFKETLQKGINKPFIFTTFNANGNRTLLRAQAEEAVIGGYDLIFTIGATCTQSVAELLRKKQSDTPQLFGGVDGVSFADSIVQINRNATGVYLQLNYENNLARLLQVKPATQSILLVYDPMHGVGLEKDKKIIEQYAANKGIAVQAVEIAQSNEIQQKVAALIPSYDVVMVLVDNTVVAGIDTLITLCNRYGVTLYASDLNSGKKGAALAYGITEYASGSGAAQKGLALLIGGKKPSDMLPTAIDQFRLELNRDTAAKQNVDISLAESVIQDMQS